ncbi:MAG TPA: hypothetical protein PL009_13665 [Flavipsychrobacter sp.]|nr:hypothetical protein [Flavipsychrobacter sp.]
MLKYVLAWFPMLLIAMANGVLRESVFKKQMGNLEAHQLSTITLLIFFAAYIWFVIQKFRPVSALQAMMVGGLWLVLTLCFEFGFGLYRGNSLATLLEDYNLLEGRLWILIPTWVAVAPYIFFKIGR